MVVKSWSGEDGGWLAAFGVFLACSSCLPSLDPASQEGLVGYTTLSFLVLHDDNFKLILLIPCLPPHSHPSRRFFYHASQVSIQHQGLHHPMSRLTSFSPPPSPDPNHRPRSSPIFSAPCTDHHACSLCNHSKTERIPAQSRQDQLSRWR
ncbi:hypothetical protein N431DRAFT_92987 [Stipitochalara longipes BDJ]|nr:hypothetical protein N431DRAFT_92987 [Stipitochalara longipes BDJ]